MNFSSDNAAGISPEIMKAIIAANSGSASAYGNDKITKSAQIAIAELFQTKIDMFPVATGTAANALAIATLTPPWGIIYCHRNSHIEEDEAGAPEFFSGGAKLHLLEGKLGKIDATSLSEALDLAGFGIEHHSQPAVVSLTQATEAGTCYRPEEIASICKVAHSKGLKVHMDGARFANAVAFLNCTPADITWKAGIDVLSFGATKNGAMAAEAIIFFDQQLASDFRYRRKRGGHLFSKMRFLSAQLNAYILDDVWLKYARNANECARRLAEGLMEIPETRIVFPTESNEVFIKLPKQILAGMKKEGVVFTPWFQVGRSTIRLVTAFNTTISDVEHAIAAARKYAD